MKNINILLITLLFSAVSTQAATLIVNNQSPNPGQYTTVAAAISASTAGDIILVKGTGIAYSGFTITKSLTVIGNGYNPKTVSTFPTVIGGTIDIANNIGNVNILGFDVGAVNSAGNNDHIKVEFCKVGGSLNVGSNTTDDWLISNCIFPSNGNYIVGGNPTNVIIEHCFMGGGIQLGSTATNIIIRNNVFTSNANYAAFGTLGNAMITNNIFYDALLIGFNGALGTCTLTNCIIAYNLTYKSGVGGNNPVPPTGVALNDVHDNVVNANPNFYSFTTVSGGAAITFAFTQDFRINAGSPALTAGQPLTLGGAGTQVGIYANSFDFSMTGEPRIPAIRAFSIILPSTNSGVGSTLNVNIKASKARAN
jgi:hypothetical protein